MVQGLCVSSIIVHCIQQYAEFLTDITTNWNPEDPLILLYLLPTAKLYILSRHID